MAAPAFVRVIRPSTALRSTLRPNALRSQCFFSTSPQTSSNADGKDIGPGKTHATDKTGGHKDPQSEASKAAHDERASGSQMSQATSEKDVGNNNERAKKDHPEAPDVVMGMNDERGGKGH